MAPSAGRGRIRVVVNNSTFRATTAADESKIIELAARAFGASANASFVDPILLRWKYWLPREDFPGPRAYVIERNGRIVAHAGLWPVIVGDECGVHMIDWMSDPDTPGAGVSLLQKLTQQFDFIYGIGGSSITLEILPKFGFNIVGDAYTWARPLRPFQQVLHHQHKDWRIGARFARNLWWSRFPARSKHRGWVVVPTDAGSVKERDEGFFRYLRACPTTVCQTFQLRNGERQEGFLALMTAEKQARIAGIWLREQSTENLRMAFELAQEAAVSHTDACEIVTRGLPEQSRIAAESAGLRLRENNPVFLYKKRGTTDGLALGFQMADNDAIFLGERAPRFLT